MVNVLIMFSGFRRYDSWTWWNNGSFRLSIPNGNLRQRLHLEFHSYGIATKVTRPGSEDQSN